MESGGFSFDADEFSSGSEEEERLQPITKDVKDLGRRARARLDEEKKKRPEIVRLETCPSNDKDPPNAKRSSVMLIRKRKKPARIRPLAKRPSPTPNAGTIDLHLPNTSHLLSVHKEHRSNVVQLHGVPVGTKPEQLRRFFTGLEPMRIFVLPQYQKRILEWDATWNEQYRNSIERYSSTQLRIFAKFSAAPVADLAVDRSGEVLFTEKESEGGATVAVTQIDKPTAQCLVRTMAIDVENAVPLERTLSNAMEELDPIVVKLLWSLVVQQLGITTEEGASDDESSELLGQVQCCPSTLKGYTEAARQYNTLVTAYERLLEQPPFPTTDECDPGLSQNPIIRLTSAAVRCLLAEMDRIDCILHRSRLKLRQEHAKTAD